MRNRPEDASALEVAARNRGYHWFNIDASSMTSQGVFINGVGKALSFPRPSGQNWDAFDDRLKDLTWFAGRWYVLVLNNVDGFAIVSPDDFRIVIEILISVSDYWWEKRVPFHVFMTGGDQLMQFDYENYLGRICVHGGGLGALEL